MEIYLRGKTWWYDFTVGSERTRKSARTKDRREAERVAPARHGKIYLGAA